MANQWLRLWHDMPTDPKWRTIAKASGHRIGDVMAVYIHILVCASNATERGRTHSFSAEDVASALDMESADVMQIIDAMQGRVLDGDVVRGWEKRQVVREDGSAGRAKAWREAKKANDKSIENATERNRTQTERRRTPDTDTDTDSKPNTSFDVFWSAYPKKVGKGAAEKAWGKAKINGHVPDLMAALEAQKLSDQWRKDGGQYIPNPATWINQRRWEDGEPSRQPSADPMREFMRRTLA